MFTLVEEELETFDLHLVILLIMQRLMKRKGRSSKSNWMLSRRNNRNLIMLEGAVRETFEVKARSVVMTEAGAA
jgi:hypothetical protein